MKRKARSLFTVLLTALIIMTMLPTTAFAASNKKVPAKVKITKVTASTNAVTVKWKKAKNATSYRIYYRKSGTSKWITVANSKKTSYTHKNNKKTALKGGVKYNYAIRAYNKSSKKWSNYGNVKSVTIPAVPGTVKVKSVKATATNKVTVKWNATSNTTSYRVFYKKSGAKKWTTVANVTGTSYTHTSNKKAPLSVGKKYVYTVRAYNKSSKKWGKYNTKGVAVTIPKKNPTDTDGTTQGTNPTQPSQPTPSPTPSHTHSYEWKVTKAATCQTTGKKQYVCKTCGNVAKTETIAKTDHTPGTPVKTVLQTANCKYGGSYDLTTYCAVCHTFLDCKTVNTPKTDHDWEFLDTQAPTCENKGFTEYVCKTCQEMKTDYTPALGHDYGEEKVVEQPTMYLTGYKKKECNRCGHAEQTTIPKLTTPVRSEQEVYNILMSFQKKYPQNSPFGYDKEYHTNRGDWVTACNAFACELSDAAFGTAREYQHSNLNDIHVGDLVYFIWTSSSGETTEHVSVVLKVNSNNVIVAEGNVGGVVQWGNTVPKTDIHSIGTRY